MFPANFHYHRAATTQEALELLKEHPEGKLLAGGHSLIPMMKLRLAQPATLIDIGRIGELKGICRDGDSIRIGALTTHAELGASAVLEADCSILAEAAREIGDPQVRNKGTIGGNLAHADPASDLPAVLVALGATIHFLGPDGKDTCPASEFCVGLLTTKLGSSQLLTEIEVPALGSSTGSCYLKVEHPASGYAVCGAAALVTMDGDKCSAVSLAFNGVASTPILAQGVADAVKASDASDQAIDKAVDQSLSIEEPLGDTYASGDYRVALARAYGKRALKLARDRAA
jgi:carbon-monoxide dehydrogenase medium subunit